MTIKKKIELRSTIDDLVLKADLYIPDNPRAVVQIIHGMSEHKERYYTLATVLNGYGYVVLIADNRGHGESVDEYCPLGYFANKNGWMVNLQDVHRFTDYLIEEFRNLPFFVIGHSMGSLIGHSYLKRYEDCLSGIIFSGMPAYNKASKLGIKMAEYFIKKKGGKSVSNFLVKQADFNKRIKNPRTAFDWISYNNENVDEYINDPLCGFPFTNAGYRDLFVGMQDVFVQKDWRVLKKDLPILFMVGEDDPCADVAMGFRNSLNNLAKVGYKKIEANIYESMRHEIFNEKDRKRVYKDLVIWLNKQVQTINENIL